MRVLQVIPWFSPKQGGDVNVCFNISKELVKKGHEVTIATTNYALNEDYINTIKKEGVNVITFNYVANLFLYLLTPSMKGWIKKNIDSFDIVHLHDFRSYQNNIATQFANQCGIPYIIQPHASTPRIIAKKNLKWLYDIVYGYRILNETSKVIAVSHEESIYDRQMGVDEDKIIVIYNGMDVDDFKKLPPYGVFKSKFGIDKKMILYVGRIHVQKGLDFLIKAFAAFVRNINDVILVIAGSDDGYKPQLQVLIDKLGIKNKVKFTGFLSEEDKKASLVDADVFVHTVKYMGGVGIAPFEAILCNTPVIVTEGCGEVIKKIECGYMVEYGNIEDLAKKLQYVLENPDEAREKTQIGKKYIIDNLRWDNVVTKVEGVYESCIRNV